METSWKNGPPPSWEKSITTSWKKVKQKLGINDDDDDVNDDPTLLPITGR